MEKVFCIQTVTTKKGVTFKKGCYYDFAVYHNGITIFKNSSDCVKIKSENQFNKFFK